MKYKDITISKSIILLLAYNDHVYFMTTPL